MVLTICVIAIVKFNGRKIRLEADGSSDCGLMPLMGLFVYIQRVI